MHVAGLLDGGDLAILGLDHHEHELVLMVELFGGGVVHRTSFEASSSASPLGTLQTARGDTDSVPPTRPASGEPPRQAAASGSHTSSSSPAPSRRASSVTESGTTSWRGGIAIAAIPASATATAPVQMAGTMPFTNACGDM